MASRREFLKIVGAGAIGASLALAGINLVGYNGRDRGGLVDNQNTVSGGRTLSALWIYVGPIGDYGWTYAHHRGVTAAGESLEWLSATYIESVSEEEAYLTIKGELESADYQVVFATSYGYMDAVKRLAEEFPEVVFYHCSGPWEEFRDYPNVSTYFAELYQLYYLNGVAAGAVTESCRVGYIPAFLIPEVVRHINAFAIGALKGASVTGNCGDGKRLEVIVTPPLNAWFAPDKARDATRVLVDQYDVDVVAFTEDTTATLEAAEKYWDEGKRVYSFSHYSNMLAYFEQQGRSIRSHLTGQISDWGPIYAYLLSRLYSGAYMKEDVWARLGDFAGIRWASNSSKAGEPEGAVYLAPLKVQDIPAKALDTIRVEYELMKELLFEPFTGPLLGYEIDSVGRPQEPVKPKVLEGRRLGRNELWSMSWFHESVTSLY